MYRSSIHLYRKHSSSSSSLGRVKHLLRTMSTSSSSRYEVRGSTGRITLTRPKKLNSLSNEMIHDLTKVYTQFSKQSEELKSVWLEGEGRAFCAGGDVDVRRSEITHFISFQKSLTFTNIYRPYGRQFWKGHRRCLRISSTMSTN